MRAFRLLLLAAGFALVTTSAAAQAPVVVVVNAKNPVSGLTVKQISDLYLGRKRSFPDGEAALPLDHVQNSPLRARFYFDLTGKPIAEINAYWARLLFSGQNSPPQPLADSAAIIDAVKKNINAIAYLDHEPSDRGVRTLLVVPPRQ